MGARLGVRGLICWGWELCMGELEGGWWSAASPLAHALESAPRLLGLGTGVVDGECRKVQGHRGLQQQRLGTSRAELRSVSGSLILRQGAGGQGEVRTVSKLVCAQDVVEEGQGGAESPAVLNHVSVVEDSCDAGRCVPLACGRSASYTAAKAW